MSQRTFAKALRLISQKKVTRLDNSDYFTKRFTVRGDNGFYSVELLNDSTAYCDCEFSKLGNAETRCSHIIACELVETNNHTEGNNMAYVKIPAGAEVTLTIQDYPPQMFRQHWVNNKGERCAGNGCPFCAQGNVPTTRYSHQVLNNKMLETWEFPQAVGTQLDALAPNAQLRQGASFRIRRIGNNYVVDPANANATPTQPENIHDYMMKVAPSATVTPISAQSATNAGVIALDDMEIVMKKAMTDMLYHDETLQQRFNTLLQIAVADLLLDDSNAQFIKQRLGLASDKEPVTPKPTANDAFKRFAELKKK